MNPFIIAYSDNPEADFILSFDDKFFLWVMTVLTDMQSSSAISLFIFPAAISLSTSISLAERSPRVSSPSSCGARNSFSLPFISASSDLADSISSPEWSAQFATLRATISVFIFLGRKKSML